MVIVGSGALQRADAEALHSAVTTIANSVSKPDNKDWRTLNVLQRVGHDCLLFPMAVYCVVSQNWAAICVIYNVDRCAWKVNILGYHMSEIIPD